MAAVDVDPIAARSPAEDYRARRAFAFASALLGFILLVTFSTQLPSGIAPDWLRKGAAGNSALWPQGWFFFAHIGRDEVHVLYSVAADGVTLTLRTEPQLTSERLWGVRRTGGAQMAETYGLFELIPDDGWTHCGGSDLASCWQRVRAQKVYQGTNKTIGAKFCGRLLSVVLDPMRWGEGPVPSVKRLANLEVTCPR